MCFSLMILARAFLCGNKNVYRAPSLGEGRHSFNYRWHILLKILISRHPLIYIVLSYFFEAPELATTGGAGKRKKKRGKT